MWIVKIYYEFQMERNKDNDLRWENCVQNLNETIEMKKKNKKQNKMINITIVKWVCYHGKKNIT